MIVYDTINISGHLACGLEEKVSLTEAQRNKLKNINLLIETLRKDIGSFYRKLQVANTEEAIAKAEADEEVDKEIRQWMEKMFVPQNKFIAELVDEFNREYAPNYDKLIPRKQ